MQGRPHTCEELFQRYVLTGDDDALGEMYLRVRGTLERVARSLCAECDAEDLLQATFVVVLKKAGHFDPSKPIVPWLVGILQREAGPIRRASMRRQVVSHSDEEAFLRSPWQIEGEELKEQITTAVDRLPSRYRDALRCCLLDGLSPKQAALRMGCNASTVRSRLARGLERLRRSLRHLGPTSLDR